MRADVMALMWDKYKEIYTDVWQLHKKHFGRPDWDSFVVEMQELNEKHKSKFCEDLLIAVAENLNGDGSKGE